MTGRSCLGLVGIFWTAGCLFFTTAGVLSFFEGDSFGIPIAVLFLGLSVAGVAMAYKGFKRTDPNQLSANAKERLVLEVARAHQGEVTVEELGVDTDLSVRECKVILDELAESGSCDAWVGRNGETIYVFRGFLPDGRARRSFDPVKGKVELEFADLEQAEHKNQAHARNEPA